MSALAIAAVLGLLLGLRHAFEPDHLAAVTTLVTSGESPSRGFRLGATWGLGHTLSLFVVGGALCVLRRQLPPALEDGFELVVAVMLVVLGVRALVIAGHGHAHPAPSNPGRRSLLVGLTHGLAGSGAMTAIAMAAMPDPKLALGYIALFGAGSAVGMGLMTAVAGRGLRALDGRQQWQRGLTVAAGLVSLVLGLVWGTPRAVRLVSRPAESVQLSLR
ncbi:MAG: urease accessory protein [Deltaproteobacteria bacterium]|nr:urease accessory protein [Deltaproteobacteria bacterium]